MLHLIKNIARLVIEICCPDILFSTKSYSQDGEDMMLRSYYEGKKNYKGFYVDVGAHHPLRFSNTAYFYNNGWRGINIEPTPSLIKTFLRKRKRDINLNIGVSNIESEMTFYEFNEPALNSFDQELSNQRHNDRSRYKIIAKTKVKVYPLGQVLSKYVKPEQIIDFFTIDVEGLDLEVLKSNDWNVFRPKFILIESDFDLKLLDKNPVHFYLIKMEYELVGRVKRTSLYKRVYLTS